MFLNHKLLEALLAHVEYFFTQISGRICEEKAQLLAAEPRDEGMGRQVLNSATKLWKPETQHDKSVQPRILHVQPSATEKPWTSNTDSGHTLV